MSVPLDVCNRRAESLRACSCVQVSVRSVVSVRDRGAGRHAELKPRAPRGMEVPGERQGQEQDPLTQIHHYDGTQHGC